jgi:hypothetical protein
MPININTDISNILNVVQHYGGEMDSSLHAVVALLARALHDSLGELIRDITRGFEDIEAKIDELNDRNL